MELDPAVVSLMFRIISWVLLVTVLYVSVRRGLTHYIHWLAGAGLVFATALIVGGLGSMHYDVVIDFGVQINAVLTFIGMMMVAAVIWTMYCERDECGEQST